MATARGRGLRASRGPPQPALIPGLLLSPRGNEMSRTHPQPRCHVLSAGSCMP